MTFAKKLLLVDPLFARPTVVEKALSALDNDIQQILSNTNVSDYDKVEQYSNVLRRHRSYSTPPPPPIVPPIVKLEQDIIDSVPSSQKYKAKKLITSFKRQRDVDVGEKGEIIYKQSKIPSSHIIDLIGDVLDPRGGKKARPLGWQAFASGLHSAKTSDELIANPTIKAFINNTNKRKHARLLRNQWIHY